MRNCINWDSEKTTLIRELYLTKGYSAGMIARELDHDFHSRFTRNSVMGKIHRMGLHKDGAGKLPPVSLRIPAAPKVKRKRKCKPEAQPRPPHLDFSPPTSGITCPCQLVELGPFNCHWPIGDPTQPGFYFCGAVVIPGMPYCPSHRQAALRPDAKSRSALCAIVVTTFAPAMSASVRRGSAPVTTAPLWNPTTASLHEPT